MKKGKKSDIKSQKKKKSSGRYSNLWLDNGNGPDLSILIRQPDKPPSKLKESAKAMKVAMPNSHGDLVEGTKAKPKKLTRAEKKARRKKAEVIPINSKSLGKTGREVHKDKPVSPPPTDNSTQIAKLEAHINKRQAAKNDALVGPPSPSPKVKKASVYDHTRGYDFASKKQDVPEDNWYETYGTQIRDTGRGMTPSGLPITDFLEGGPFAPPKKESELQTVTETANEEWTYEELATKYDQLHLDMHTQKTEYETRLEYKDETISNMEKVLFDLRQEKRVEQFNDSHTQNYEVAVIELQEENSYLTRDNELLSKEVDTLMDDVDKLQRHLNASNNSKPPLKILANQFNIFKVQWRDDPLKAYLRLSPYDPRMTKDLRQFFDNECDVRCMLSEERKVYRKWANQSRKRLRWSVRTRNEVKALRNIGVNAAVMRKPEHNDWHCSKLKVTDCNGLADRNIRMNILPLTGEASHDAYCKVWEEFKSVTPRTEWEQEVRSKKREAQAKAVQDTVTYKVVKPVLDAIRTVDKVLDYELSSKKRAELKRQQKLEKKRAKAEASRIKREREDSWERDLELERIKKAQRIAY